MDIEHREKDTPQSKPKENNRRSFLHLACALYLLYLAYRLGSDFVSGLATGWNVNRIICLLGTVVFTGVAIVLIVGCIRRFFAAAQDTNDKKNKDQEGN